MKFKTILQLILAAALVASAQEDIVDRTPLGKKASPFLSGPKASGGIPEFAAFSKLGIGYQSNVHRSPYHFDATNGGEATRQFPTHINLPRSDFPMYLNGGGELTLLPGRNQLLRLMVAAQEYQFPEEKLKNISTMNGFGSYRIDLNRSLRVDVQGQLDLIDGQSTLIFGSPNYLTWDEYLNGEGSVELSAYTVPATIIGRGRTQLMALGRYRDYGAPVRTATTRDTILYMPGYNDSLELDYRQYRARLRHTQGLISGFSIVASGDYLYRHYLYHRAKVTADGMKMGDTPIDTATGLPTGPLRVEHQTRFYAGVRFDAPHIKRLRFTAGLENTVNSDPYQGFYSYGQWAFRATALYQPSDIGYTEFTLATKMRSYEKLKANLNLAFSGYLLPNYSEGEKIAQGDTTWKKTKLETNVVEVRWRGQVPIASFIALWGLYQLDMRISNRLAYEIQSREYFDQRVSGGLTLYYRSDLW